MFLAPRAMITTDTAMTRMEIPMGKAAAPGVPSVAVELGIWMDMTSHHRPSRKPTRPSAVSELNIEFVFFGSKRLFTLSYNWWKRTAENGVAPKLTIRTANTVNKLI